LQSDCITKHCCINMRNVNICTHFVTACLAGRFPNRAVGATPCLFCIQSLTIFIHKMSSFRNRGDKPKSRWLHLGRRLARLPGLLVPARLVSHAPAAPARSSPPAVPAADDRPSIYATRSHLHNPIIIHRS